MQLRILRQLLEIPKLPLQLTLEKHLSIIFRWNVHSSTVAQFILVVGLHNLTVLAIQILCLVIIQILLQPIYQFVLNEILYSLASKIN